MPLFSPYSEIVSARTLLTAGTPIAPRLYLHTPDVVFVARAVLLDPADYPFSFVAYTDVTTGVYTAIRDGMTILIGSSSGADDLGRQRVRGAATTISIFVGRSSQGHFDGELEVLDGAWITVLNEYRVWAKIPFIDEDGLIFKDSALEVSWRTTTPPPVSNCGAGFASTIDPDTGLITVLFNGQHSFATAAGATIVTYLWDIADGTLTTGTLASDNITAQFPAGFRYIHLTVTDSEGHSHTSHCPVYARDPDDDTSFDGFDIESHTITDAGVRLTIRALQDMPLSVYRDGTLAMLWLRDQAAAADRTQMILNGWLDTEDTTLGAGRNGLLRDTTLVILDMAARLDSLPGFPQSVADDETRDVAKIPEITWNYMVAPTMDLYMHYLWAWHSTALEVADFIWSGTGLAYQIAIKNSDGDSLWNQAWRIAQAMCPGFVLTCDQAGAIRVVPDPQLLDLADRSSVVQAAITEGDYSDLRFGRQRAPRTHWLRTGALVVQSSISFNPIPAGAPAGTAPTVNLPTVFSIAPGTTPGQGLGESENNEQLVASQDILNSATGHRYARLNAATGLLTLTLIQDDGAPGTQTRWREIEPALKEWVTLDLGAAYAAQRGLSFATVRALPKEVTIRYSAGKAGLLRTVELTLELETSGQPGKTVLKPTDIPAVGEDPAVVPPPIPPPDDGLIGGQDLVAGIGQFELYRTADFTTPSSSGGPTWEAVSLTGSDEILTWVVDPFSPGYLTGAGSIDGWAATETAIYRITDIFGATSCNAIVTFVTGALWRTVQASFGTYFVSGSNPWLICISYYGDAVGHTGTWATYSKDGGATWSAEVLVSPEYDSGGASNPIGLYCSPKTPGLAYTIAHTETANPAGTGGYISTDWGATWTAMLATEDPDFPLPFFGQFVDGNNTTTTTQDYAPMGRMPRASLSRVDSGITVGNRQWSDALCISPPANIKRITITGAYSGYHENHGFGSTSHGLTTGYKNPPFDGIGKTVISDVNNGQTGDGQTYGRDFTYQYDFGNFAIHDWPANRDILEADPAPAASDFAFTFGIGIFSNATIEFTAWSSLVLTVDEMILDDGTVYVPTIGIIQPVHGQGGEIHIPWPSNADEGVIYYGSLDRSGSPVIGLQRVDAGVITDISEGAYGVNHGAFSIRCHDSDRSFALLAGESGAGSSGVWSSVDGGDTWTEIVTPSAVSHYQAAFGDDETEIFIWGPAEFITFSDDSGATNDDRSGNLSALSATRLIGIAGGPTP